LKRATPSSPLITRVELQRVEDVPLARPLALAWDPGVVRATDSFTIARVHTGDGDGDVGVGTVGRSQPARLGAARLIGRSALDSDGNAALLDDVPGSYGLDIALWDLAGKLSGRSIASMWGARVDRVRAYASTIEIGSIAQRVDDARGFVDEGFRGVKIRLHHESYEDDVAFAAAMRAAIGDDVALMADANQARAAEKGTATRWTFDRAVRTAGALDELGFAWLEEPLAADDLDQLANLRESVAIPIAGGERDRSRARLSVIAASGAYDIIQPDAVTGAALGHIGALAALARDHDVRCYPHHGGGGIGGYAHLHLLAAIDGDGWFEVLRDRPGEVPWPAQLVPIPPIALDEAGFVVVPDGAGLGIELDESLLDAYTTSRTVIDEPAR
jgi:D-galactarolactone cycloisomerase